MREMLSYGVSSLAHNTLASTKAFARRASLPSNELRLDCRIATTVRFMDSMAYISVVKTRVVRMMRKPRLEDAGVAPGHSQVHTSRFFFNLSIELDQTSIILDIRTLSCLQYPKEHE